VTLLLHRNSFSFSIAEVYTQQNDKKICKENEKPAEFFHHDVFHDIIQNCGRDSSDRIVICECIHTIHNVLPYLQGKYASIHDL
jgi:hypothetical protein